MVETKVKKKTGCPWCDYNAFCKQEKECDFRSLSFRKDMIMARIETEIDWIVTARKTALSSAANMLKKRELLEGIIDRTKGIEIMTSVLKAEFGVKDDELKPMFMAAKMSSMEKLKMYSQLKTLKRAGGSK